MTSARELKIAAEAELLQELRHHAQTSTKWLEMLGGQLVNHVLEVFYGPIGTDGTLTRGYGVAAGCMKVCYVGPASIDDFDPTDKIVVSSAPPGPNAPMGTGSWPIFAGHTDVVPLASRNWTIYGTAGHLVAVQVFTSSVQPVTVAGGPYIPPAA